MKNPQIISATNQEYLEEHRHQIESLYVADERRTLFEQRQEKTQPVVGQGVRLQKNLLKTSNKQNTI